MNSGISGTSAKTFIGSLVHSQNLMVQETAVSFLPLNDLLVKVTFDLDGKEIMFRGMTSSQNEGTLMLVKDRVTDKYILSGQSGFLYKKPNIHGGFLNQLNSFYFHIRLEYYHGRNQEIYFIGKEASERQSYLDDHEHHFTKSA